MDEKQRKEVAEILKEVSMIQEADTIKSDIKTLIYNTDKINDKLKEQNAYLEKISWRAAAITFILMVPIIFQWLMLIFGADTLRELFDIIYS